MYLYKFERKMKYKGENNCYLEENIVNLLRMNEISSLNIFVHKKFNTHVHLYKSKLLVEKKHKKRSDSFSCAGNKGNHGNM